MDGVQFDAITKTLAMRRSRRTTLRGIAAAALAAGVGLLGREEAAAGCKNLGQKCKKKNGKKKKCCSGAKCKGKKCKCPGGTEECGGACVPACQSDVQARNSLDCSCCQIAGAPTPCGAFGPCCGACTDVGGQFTCMTFPETVDCEFDAQCQSGVCGCLSSNCSCRPADCTATGDPCSSNLECCQGVCSASSLICHGGPG